MEKSNTEIRKDIFVNQLRHWQVANQAGITDATLCRWLRTPLSDERRERVQKAIHELIEKQKNEVK